MPLPQLYKGQTHFKDLFQSFSNAITVLGELYFDQVTLEKTDRSSAKFDTSQFSAVRACVRACLRAFICCKLYGSEMRATLRYCGCTQDFLLRCVSQVTVSLDRLRTGLSLSLLLLHACSFPLC